MRSVWSPPASSDATAPLQVQRPLFGKRIGRARFVLYKLRAVLVLYAGLAAHAAFHLPQAAWTAVAVAFLLYVLWLTGRRLNDTNDSGLMLLGLFVPLLNLYVMYRLYFVAGDEGPNENGDPPGLAPPYL